MTKTKKIKLFTKILTKEFLLEHYVKQNKSPYTIAEEVGCSPKSVYHYVNKHDIQQIDHTVHRISPGQKFGLLTTVKIIGSHRRGNIWLCKCECGNPVRRLAAILQQGQNKNRRQSCNTCKFQTRESNRAWKGYGEISGHILSTIRTNTRRRNLKFDLDAKFLWELFLKQNKKCAMSGLDIIMGKNASLDRIDSFGNYTQDNVWWAHKDVNKMKMDLEYNHFLKMCKIISDFHQKDINE